MSEYEAAYNGLGVDEMINTLVSKHGRLYGSKEQKA